MNGKRIGVVAAGIAAAGAIALGGTALAHSGDTSGSSTAAGNSTTVTAPLQAGAPDQSSGAGPGNGGQELTGTDAQAVVAAVTAHASGVSVDRVLKNPDGSYLALTQANGTKTVYQVSADLATVTAGTLPDPGVGGGTSGPGAAGAANAAPATNGSTAP